jgi:hypothetical protein
MSMVTLPDGRTVDFIIRREVGSINRFLYSIAMLAVRRGRRRRALAAAPTTLGLWNRKLLYWFQGGVAIGHSQGTVHSGSLNPDILRQGFAIVHSSGNNTGTHYNMNLAGETALMTKERFIERYGVPLYTDRPGRLRRRDPAVPDRAEPPRRAGRPAAGAELPRHGDADHPRRRLRAARALHGRHRPQQPEVAHDEEPQLAGGLQRRGKPARRAEWPRQRPAGAAEAGARLQHGGRQHRVHPGLARPDAAGDEPAVRPGPNAQFYEPQSAIAAIRWTHYDDLRNVYGVDATGAARRPGTTWACSTACRRCGRATSRRPSSCT